MTIFLNVPAVILLIVILLVRHLVSLFLPELDSFFHPYSWLIFYLISGAGEMIKLKGRIFWIPMWLIGFIAVIISSYLTFNTTEFYVVIAILLVMYTIGFFILRKITKKNWGKAKVSLKQINSDTAINKRKLFINAFYIPSYINPVNSLQYMVFEKIYQNIYIKWMSNQEVNLHYITTLDKLKEFVSEDDYNKHIVVFRKSLDKIKENKTVYLEQYMFENILKLIKTTKFHQTN